jgi:hypothetical protein
MCIYSVDNDTKSDEIQSLIDELSTMTNMIEEMKLKHDNDIKDVVLKYESMEKNTISVPAPMTTTSTDDIDNEKQLLIDSVELAQLNAQKSVTWLEIEVFTNLYTYTYLWYVI